MTVSPQVVVSRIAPDFMGLGYETSAVAQSNYFSAKNLKLIQLYHNLSSHGLIRIGGNISDHTRYLPHAPAEVHTEKEVTIINQTKLVEVAGFARATGWKVMWGLNLGTDSQTEAVEEAVAVSTALGDSLHSFEIGNEVDLHGGYDGKFHDYEGYYSNYLAYKAAIRAALPQAKISGPDVANKLAWLTAFAGPEAGDVRLLTCHYYRTGAHRPDATIENLLREDTVWTGTLQKLKQVCEETHGAFRINEVNSFYGGGKAGVSDTFASALWCLDYMFQLASASANGINLETDINQLGWLSHYSPIIHGAAGDCEVRPEYYGMLAFAMAGQGDLVKLAMEKGTVNLSAYTTKSAKGVIWLTLVNKDLGQDAEVEVNLPENYRGAEAYRLSAPSVESTNHVTFAGNTVSDDGKFKLGPPENVTIKGGKLNVPIPHASAVLVRCK